jgi:ACT domain-containing protein
MARRILTADDVARLPEGSRLEVDEQTTVTPAARDLAARRGIDVIDLPSVPGVGHGGGAQGGAGASGGARAGAGVGSRTGGQAGAVPPGQLAGRTGRDAGTASGVVPALEGMVTSGGASLQPVAASGPPASIIVSAVGVNRPGVLAEVTAAVGQLQGDIIDVSQRVTGGYFNAILVVDIRGGGRSFADFRDALHALSEPSDYIVNVMDERVFRAMHRI